MLFNGASEASALCAATKTNRRLFVLRALDIEINWPRHRARDPIEVSAFGEACRR